MANADYQSDKITIEFDDTALAEPGAELASLRIGSDGQVRTRVHGGSEAVAGAGVAATAVSDHEDAYDHGNIPTSDQVSVLAAYQAALAAAENGEVLTAVVDGETRQVEFAAVAAGVSLSDYQNVIVVDGGGNGDYTSLAEAVAAAGTNDLIVVFGGTYSSPVTISAARTIFIPSYSTIISGVITNTGPGLNIIGHGRVSSLVVSGSGVCRLLGGVRVGAEVLDSARIEAANCDFDALSIRSATANYKIRGCRLGSLDFTYTTAASANRFFSMCDIESAYNEVAFMNMPLYHCRIVAIDPDTVGVASGNYSNTLAGITWPAIA